MMALHGSRQRGTSFWRAVVVHLDCSVHRHWRAQSCHGLSTSSGLAMIEALEKHVELTAPIPFLQHELSFPSMTVHWIRGYVSFGGLNNVENGWSCSSIKVADDGYHSSEKNQSIFSISRFFGVWCWPKRITDLQALAAASICLCMKLPHHKSTIFRVCYMNVYIKEKKLHHKNRWIIITSSP